MKKLMLLAGLLTLTSCAGKDGAAGASATAVKISAILTCNNVVSGQTGNAAALNNLIVGYQISKMNSGDVYVTASVGGSTYTISSSNFYSSSQNGASTGSITVGYDAGTASYAYFGFSGDITAGTASFNYQDTTPSTNVTVSLTGCTKASF